MPTPGDTPLDSSVLKKVDEALLWWTNVRKASKSCLDGATSNPTTVSLRQQMHGKLSEMFNAQVQLERIRMFGQGNVGEIKTILNTFVTDLVQVQEMIKGIQAMT